MTHPKESVLMDTSVWIDAFRGKTPRIVEVAKRLLQEDRVLTCGPVLFEIRRGIRPTERRSILPLLDALVRLPWDESLWDEAGELGGALRRKGITIPPMDVVIAQLCLRHEVPIFTLDQHFQFVSGLQLFQPPTV